MNNTITATGETNSPPIDIEELKRKGNYIPRKCRSQHY